MISDLPKTTKNKSLLVLGVLFLGLIVIGLVASLMLTKQGQDIRQQASETSLVPEDFGTSINFPGGNSNTFVRLNNTLPADIGNEGLTFEVWVKPNSNQTSSTSPIFILEDETNKNQYLSLEMSNSTNGYFPIVVHSGALDNDPGGGYMISGRSLHYNEWHHLAFTIGKSEDKCVMTLFIDGSPSNSRFSPPGGICNFLTGGKRILDIGKITQYPTSDLIYYSGEIEEFRISAGQKYGTNESFNPNFPRGLEEDTIVLASFDTNSNDGALAVKSNYLTGPENTPLRLLAYGQNYQFETSQVPLSWPEGMIDEDVYLWFEPIGQNNNGKFQLKFNIIASSEGKGAVDGIQFFAYLYSTHSFESIDSQLKILSENLGTPIQVVQNEIVEAPEGNRVKLVKLAILSADPSQPIELDSNGTVVASFVVTVDDMTNEQFLDDSIVVYLDKTKSKLIDNAQGENLVALQNFQEVNYHYSDYYDSLVAPTATPTLAPPTATPTTAPPTATPTLVPTATPTTAAPPTATPTETTAQSDEYVPFTAEIALQGFSGLNQYTTNLPIYQYKLWNPSKRQNIPLYDVGLKPADGGNYVIFSAKYRPSDTFFDADFVSAIFYLKISKYHSLAKSVTLSENTYPGVLLNLKETPVLVGELTGDYIIDVEDYHQLVRRFSVGQMQTDSLADLNFDGVVDITDYALLAENFDISYHSEYLPN